MIKFSSTIEKSQYKEKVFLKEIKKLMLNLGILTFDSTFKSGESVTKYRGDINVKEKSQNFTYTENPFNFKYKLSDNKIFGHYYGRINVDHQKTYQKVQTDLSTMEYNTYDLQGDINFKVSKTIPTILIIIAIILLISSETGLFFLFALLSIVSYIVAKILGNKFMPDVNKTLTNFFQNYKD